MRNTVLAIIISAFAVLSVACGGTPPATDPQVTFAATTSTFGVANPIIVMARDESGAGMTFADGFSFVPVQGATFTATSYMTLYAWDCPDGTTLTPASIFTNCTNMASWSGASQTLTSGQSVNFTSNVAFSYTTGGYDNVVIEWAKNVSGGGVSTPFLTVEGS